MIGAAPLSLKAAHTAVPVPFVLLVAVSFVVGLARPPWWTLALGPLACLAVGGVTVLREPPEYDMPGFGLIVGALAAGLCVAAWLGGRLAARLFR